MGTDTTTSRSGRTFGYVDVAAVLVGLFVLGFGLLLVPQSVLGGAWIAAVGVALLLAGVLDTEWAGQRFGVSDADRRGLVVTFLVLAVVLSVAFVVINGFGDVDSVEDASSVLPG